MNRKSKFDQEIERAVAGILNDAVEKWGIEEVLHAAVKWSNRQKEIRKLKKRQAELQQELDEIGEKVGQ